MKHDYKLYNTDLCIWQRLSEIVHASGRPGASRREWKEAGAIRGFDQAVQRLQDTHCVEYDPERHIFIPKRKPGESDYTEPPEDEHKKWPRMAQEFIDKHFPAKSRRLIYYRGGFYCWTGTHYAALDDAALNSQLYLWLDKPGIRARDEVCCALQAATHIDRELQAPAWFGGSHPSAVDYLACQNGLLSLSTGCTEPHSPDFLTMIALPCDFDPSAKAPPRWKQFLEECWGDDTASIALCQEMFGYVLSRSLDQQKLFMLVGPKRSGKGTIARVLKALLGGDQNVAAPTLASLKDKSGLEGLIDKTAAIIADARLEGYGTHEVVERLLAISGQDALDVHRKYKTTWHGTLGVRFLILSNELPAFTDASGAIISRFMVLRTHQSFFGREDTKLTDKLLAELSGILNANTPGV